MVKVAVVSILFLFSAAYAEADNMLFYKYADGNTYSFYVASDNSSSEAQSAKDTIVRRLMSSTFSIKDISPDFYKITTTPNVFYYGEKLTQYTIIPISKDRFSQVIWVDSKGMLIKKEIYDTKNNLVYAFGVLDTDNDGKNPLSKSHHEKELKPLVDKCFYKGFYHAYTQKMSDGVLHLVFMDGLNRFSVFMNPHPTEDGTIAKIIFGNYLLSKVVSGIEYTVVGSVPYSFMEEVIGVLNTSKDIIIKQASEGKAVTEDLLIKQKNSNAE